MLELENYENHNRCVNSVLTIFHYEEWQNFLQQNPF